ncbi:MAG: leucyl aminopeptidase family protein [Nannocystaceae bacterium]|nr:leucyl aminopeptidase family protein [bacterium]
MVDHLAARPSKGTVLLYAVQTRAYKRWLKGQPKIAQNWLKSLKRRGTAGELSTIPDRNGALSRAVLVYDEPTPWVFASAAAKLPAARYQLDGDLSAAAAGDAALGWALATRRFDRYKSSNRRHPTLVWPEQADREHVERLFRATVLGRDLITTPAEDMGPAELVDAGVQLAKQCGAKTSVIVGDALLDKGYPAVHAVGRAAARAPRLLDLTWGDPNAPKLSVVGKGVCFDSGGLDLKSAAGMKLMKKDMGGAATALALASLVMESELPVRLRVLIPAVENAVSGNALRPGDVIDTRKGLSVEIGNTDAEGRLIMSDCLTEASSESPDQLIDFATLTGAARVALGTELPALFSTDDAFAAAVLEGGLSTHDPLWRMPLHRPYRRHLDSTIADLNNIANVGQGGAITAALFLSEFVAKGTNWSHVDTMAYYTGSRPGRPAGGEVFGIRAFYDALAARYAPEPDTEAETD